MASDLGSDLGDAELEVLRILWDEGPRTVREVMNHLHERGRKVAYTTVLTFLTRLEQKQFVRSDKSGVAYVYKPTVTRERVTRSRLRAIADQLFDGTVGSLVLHLMREETFSRREINELHQLIDQLDTNRRTPGRPSTS
ncbi:MAG: BlaI/MecI/CopY family transcriptional regulator [Phycisphaerales bacterium]|nr:BlaI/MecI/CopY family transcriptional regulator [Phycisphaerales bacterium]